MPKLIFLGTSNAIPDLQHENTHLALVSEKQLLMIDCVSNPIVRLSQAGLNVHDLTDLLLTHFHPDHVSGVPSLLMNSWLLGRQRPLHIHGLAYTLERIEKLMDFYEWSIWPGFYPVEFHPVAEQELSLLLDYPEFRLYTSPVCHMVPCIGLRIEFTGSGQVAAYSCDTAPCPQVVRLAAGADVLVHEATGAGVGHTSAAQAGEIAEKAGSKTLYLIHYPTGDFDPRPLMAEAKLTYPGPVTLAQDFMELTF
jgi:ribonuclease Z